MASTAGVEGRARAFFEGLEVQRHLSRIHREDNYFSQGDYCRLGSLRVRSRLVVRTNSPGLANAVAPWEFRSTCVRESSETWPA